VNIGVNISFHYRAAEAMAQRVTWPFTRLALMQLRDDFAKCQRCATGAQQARGESGIRARRRR
jgi:hypothetical protein